MVRDESVEWDSQKEVTFCKERGGRKVAMVPSVVMHDMWRDAMIGMRAACEKLLKMAGLDWASMVEVGVSCIDSNQTWC